MKFVVGGTRGTSPVAQAGFTEFGGETTSYLVEGACGERVLVDAGTGVRLLGRRLQDSGSREALLLMTHYHLDHVMGLPSLPLIYSERWSLQLAAPVRGGESIESVMPRLLHTPFWPLQLEELQSHITYATLPGPASREPMHVGGLEISWCPVHHPDECTAYRIDEPATGGSVVIATDVEWRLSTQAEREGLLRLCAEPRPSALLVMDGNYLDEEYDRHKGWGHSTWTDVLEVARLSGVPRAWVTHHSVDATDGVLAERERRFRQADPRLTLARERAELDFRAS